MTLTSIHTDERADMGHDIYVVARLRGDNGQNYTWPRNPRRYVSWEEWRDGQTEFLEDLALAIEDRNLRV